MKKILTLFFALLMVLSLCGCGSETTTQAEASESKGTEAEAGSLSEVYAEDFVAVEDINYEMSKSEIHNLNIKIRNTTSENMIKLYFRVQALDVAGDVLDSWNMGSSDRLDAGQGYWFYCSGDIFEDCKSIEAASEKAASIRVLSVHIQKVKDDASSWVDYDFKEPPVFKVADIQPKA